jgi:hypothetical protein
VVRADAIKFVYVPPILPPTIAAHPQNQTVKATSNATFSVTATGTAPLQYQWYFEGGLLSGATLSSYTRLAVQASHAGNYRVAVVNVSGAITSNPALLTVLPLQPPVITAQPRSQAAVPGGNAIFFVTASSASPLQYQWRLNGTDLIGQSNDTLTLGDLQPAQFGTYTVRLSNSDGWLVSNPAALTMAVPPLLVPSASGTTLRLSFLSELGPVYAVQYASGLESADWQGLTNVPGTGDLIVIDEPLATDQARLFRIQVQ